MKREEQYLPIQKDSALVEALAQLQIDRQLPASLFQVVVELFATLEQGDQKLKEGGDAGDDPP